MDAPIFPLASSAMQSIRLSKDFRNQLNKQLHSRNSSSAVLISPGLLSGSSPKHLRQLLLPCRRDREWLIVLPHLNNGDMGSTVNLSLRSIKRIWGPLLFLRKLRGRSPDARGLRQMRTPPPPQVERSTPNFTVSVSLQCLQRTVLPTQRPPVLQVAAVSGERISQGPPGNVVALGCPPPPRRVSERSVQMLPVGSPFQDVILIAQLHINPETSLERLVLVMHRSWFFVADSDTDFFRANWPIPIPIFFPLSNQQEIMKDSNTKWLYSEYRFYLTCIIFNCLKNIYI